LGSHFFGLGVNYRPLIHKEIFQLVFYTKGSFPWLDVYNMPVFLRKFYLKEVEQAFIEKAKAIEDATRGSSSNGISKPGIIPK